MSQRVRRESLASKSARRWCWRRSRKTISWRRLPTIASSASLIATLLLTGLATFAVGFVPTYDQVGIWGAVILTVIRFIQGVGIGREWGGPVNCGQAILRQRYADQRARERLCAGF